MTRYPFLVAIPPLLALSGSAGAVTSAELYRPAAHTFGKFEARVRFAGGNGVVGSFFLWKEGSEMANTYWNELDFEKVGAACELQTNSIYGLPQSSHEGRGYGLANLCTGYRTYAYEWTPDYIAWLVDGTEIRRDTGAGAMAYAENATLGMEFRFNIWPGNASFGGTFSEAILPVYQFVAWAQYSEYTPSAGDGGSNFTLAWREEFDTSPSGWQTGSWASPLNGSIHGAQNVAFVDGIAVLALTSDNATGYSGTPPADDGTIEMLPPGEAGPPSSEDGGCSCRLAPSASSPAHAGAFLACAAVGGLRRRRSRREIHDQSRQGRGAGAGRGSA